MTTSGIVMVTGVSLALTIAHILCCVIFQMNICHYPCNAICAHFFNLAVFIGSSIYHLIVFLSIVFSRDNRYRYGWVGFLAFVMVILSCFFWALFVKMYNDVDRDASIVNRESLKMLNLAVLCIAGIYGLIFLITTATIDKQLPYYSDVTD